MRLQLIKGDVLDTLNRLDTQYDLAYLDPPFFTQRTHKMAGKRGKTIRFSDEWKSFEEYILWLESVFVECFNHLKDTGTIYSHNNFIINAELYARLPEDIKKRFLTNISWQRSHPHNNIKNSWGNIVDSICVYSRGAKPYFIPQYADLDEAYKANSFNNKDSNGYYALAPITGEKSRVGHKYPYKGFNPQYGWRTSKEKLEELDAQGLLHIGKNKLYKKIYASESKGRPIQNIWTDVAPITRTEVNKREYPTQKPVKLLERIIRSSCPQGGSMLDPFAGSGTTFFASDKTQLPELVTLIDENPQAIAIINKGVPFYVDRID